jgi:hypothetical protein
MALGWGSLKQFFSLCAAIIHHGHVEPDFSGVGVMLVKFYKAFDIA